MKVEKSLILTILGVLVLFALAIGVTVVAPGYVDSSWTEPSSYYQSQMYEVSDPNVFLDAAIPGSDELQYVHRLTEGFSLVSFEERPNSRIIASPDLEKYITHYNEKPLKLTSRVLLLRKAQAPEKRKELQAEWRKQHPEDEQLPYFEILELYVPGGTEAFAVTEVDEVTESWVDKDFVILDPGHAPYHKDPGVIYVKNPQEYRVSLFKNGWQYDPNGQSITSVEGLTSKEHGFMSRQELIRLGEEIFKIEGCWYCHTDQSRTLVQDCVVNGSASHPAPPSSANEYIYQEVTFPGTRRIGPDLARVGVKRPGRDWHMAHFWSPGSKSHGSIMPPFRHFFDENQDGLPNYKFEAILQYLMTKGTRITCPTQAWWLGLDPIQTINVIEGKKK